MGNPPAPPNLRPRKSTGLTALVALAALWLALAPQARAEDAAPAASTAPASTLADLRAAAEGGDSDAQYRLGLRLADGIGVAANPLDGYVWLNLAARSGHEQAAQARDAAAAKLSAADFASAQKRIMQLQRGAQAALGAGVPPRGSRPAATSTGILVDRAGHILTNRHAVKDCKRVQARAPGFAAPARLKALDNKRDLALLETGAKSPAAAPFRAGTPRLGAAVAVFGYPLQGILDNGANITTGVVSGLAGPGNDGRLLQISAPVQPGNSGGPLLDAAGNVAGVVVSKIDARQVARLTGDYPENVNFAVKAEIAAGFLAEHGVTVARREGQPALSTEDIAERASAFTAILECWR